MRMVHPIKLFIKGISYGEIHCVDTYVRSSLLLKFCLSVSAKITNKHLLSCFYQFLNTIGCSFVVEGGQRLYIKDRYDF